MTQSESWHCNVADDGSPSRMSATPERTDDQTTVSESTAPGSPALSAKHDQESGTGRVLSYLDYISTSDDEDGDIARLARPDPVAINQPTVEDEETDTEVLTLPAVDVLNSSTLLDDCVDGKHLPEQQKQSAEHFPSSPAGPFSPVPAFVPLPSPSLTEARFMHSPSPENHSFHPPHPGFVGYPAPRFSSPLAYSHFPRMSPNMSPYGTPPPPVPSMAVVPTAPSSIAPVPHSPAMSSIGVVPPYAPYASSPPPTEYHFPSRAYGYSEQSYTSASQAVRDLSLSQVHDNGAISPLENDSEHIELLQRIQSAIPDISRLLHGFKSTHSKLSSREAEIKHIGHQHEQALMHKDFYIEALQAQMRKTANESAAECAKLKNTVNELQLELGDLYERQNGLEDSLAAHQKSNEELSQSKLDLEAQITKLNARIQETQHAHEKEIEKQQKERDEALEAQRLELTELFEEIKNEDEKTAAEALATREKELLDQHAANRAGWEKEKAQITSLLEFERNNMESINAELATKSAECESKRTELDAALAEVKTTRDDLMAKLAAKQKELEETNVTNRRDLEALHQGHAGELESLQHSHEEHLAAAVKKMEDHTTSLETNFREQEQKWAEERAVLETLLSEKDSELSSFEQQKEKLEMDTLIKEQQLQRAADEMRSTIDHLDKDCHRLRTTLHSLGEATDLKNTKGDQFFFDCFTQLAHLISDLSYEHFSYLPVDPPTDILSKIPPEIPPFLDNTPASRELRCAYVQHIVSKTLTYRIFQPFLFTLGRRYDKADAFFQMLSMDIRRKSVCCEAFWRQQTLKAAYTTSDAKQSINVAAAVLVDEIIDQIQHFADPRHLDSLLTDVRKIVKLAAETWRYARVEHELVLAGFPAPGAESVANEDWMEYGPAAPAAAGEQEEKSWVSGPRKNHPSDHTRHVVLRIFPRILREAAHEDFASSEERAATCIYSPGIVLYSDSPVILARREELATMSAETSNFEMAKLDTAREIDDYCDKKLMLENITLSVPSPPATPGAKGLVRA
ncbi:hypothetical protein N7474_002883 [Penicillium riverlandense]|uniref:uncharacterized protein n=1 Tax=Penicillium riverlandense TaxID=1903569 RepID=UPI00254909E0|nr:uncharacterized protein N7474_002883 [Penicillium riverlandense]KAJ5825745.1 hypothetical protein N7474_002883 [Penicillium riverlandense]